MKRPALAFAAVLQLLATAEASWSLTLYNRPGLYAWSGQGDDHGWAVVLGRDDNCWGVDNGVMSISTVSLRTGSKRRGLPTVVKANYYVYRNGSIKYRLPIGSEHEE
ncbi:hypothetical protein AFLA_011189 [Aspergillus flavus NRRL3357]|nr:hypothetical protein AFLA_011189 [Aspergillus flavus NRRL3357]KOC07191.1 hypothetical protein AFLA70_71g003843 [Aspergillus flavus AF70]